MSLWLTFCGVQEWITFPIGREQILVLGVTVPNVSCCVKSVPTGRAGGSGKAINPWDVSALGPTSPMPSAQRWAVAAKGRAAAPRCRGKCNLHHLPVLCRASGAATVPQILEWRGSSSGRLLFTAPAVHSCSMADWKDIYSPPVNNLEGSESQLCKAPTVSARCVSGSHCKGDWHLEEILVVV